jgi:hypothetical protein
VTDRTLRTVSGRIRVQVCLTCLTVDACRRPLDGVRARGASVLIAVTWCRWVSVSVLISRWAVRADDCLRGCVISRIALRAWCGRVHIEICCPRVTRMTGHLRSRRVGAAAARCTRSAWGGISVRLSTGTFVTCRSALRCERATHTRSTRCGWVTVQIGLSRHTRHTDSASSASVLTL